MNELIGIFILLLLIPLILILIIYLDINKFRNIKLKNKITGCEIANNILDDNNLSKMYVVENKGFLSDKYDYDRNAIKLNSITFNNNDIASISIAAFYGYLATNNKYINFRSRFENVIKYSIYLMYILFVIGILVKMKEVIMISIILNIVCLIYYGYICYLNKSMIKNIIKSTKIKNENIELFLNKYYLIDLTKIIMIIFNN